MSESIKSAVKLSGLIFQVTFLFVRNIEDCIPFLFVVE